MILITGASGFIGQHLIKRFIEAFGAQNIVAFTSTPTAECQYLLHQDYQFEQDYFIEQGFQNIDTIVHAGAFTPKIGATANNIDSCNSNIFNTARLINATLPALKKFIFLSSLDVYGEDKIIQEISPIAPVSLYGHSKYYCEQLIEAWAKTESKICQVLRVGHVYGPGEEAYQKIIPVTIKKILTGTKLEIWGTGKERRAFIHISNVVDAIKGSVALNEYVGPVNLVSGQEITIIELVEMLKDISTSDVEIEIKPAGAKGRDLVFDNTKMLDLFNIKETPLREGLEQEWLYMKEKLS